MSTRANRIREWLDTRRRTLIGRANIDRMPPVDRSKLIAWLEERMMWDQSESSNQQTYERLWEELTLGRWAMRRRR